VRNGFSVFCGFLCLLVSSFAAADPDLSVVTPPGLEVPPGQAQALMLHASGVLIYECQPKASDPTKFEWVLKSFEADLYDYNSLPVGRYYAGPTWELDDGGKVIGRLKTTADSPDGKGMPWQLFDVVQASGTIMGKIKSIRCVKTYGGKVPNEPATEARVGQESRAEFHATYKFYAGKS
jgi:hypothetical protein